MSASIRLLSAHRFPACAVRIRMVALLGIAGVLNACTWTAPVRYTFEPIPRISAEDVEIRRSVSAGDDTVIGRLATVQVPAGAALADVGRHFDLGHEQIRAANPDVDMWAPEPNSRVVLPLRFVLPEAPRTGIVVNLAAMRMFFFPPKGGGKQVVTYPVGIGKEGRSTPTGAMAIARKAERPTWYVPESIRRDHARKGDPLPAAVLPGPDNPLGDYALYLTRPSYLIHGTNKPYAIGLRASNGCLRLYPEDIAPLYKAAPLKTPVRIVNQPYLLGWRAGDLYLEAHVPHDELNAKSLKSELFAKLRKVEKQHGRSVDWPKVEALLSEAKGIPTPVFEGTKTLARLIGEAVLLKTPGELYGSPAVPEMTGDGWYVKALETREELTARRLAAVLNHFGPQIPARAVELDGSRYSVVAGPFKDAKEAKSAARRMQVDLEIAGELVPPKESLALRQLSIVAR